MSGNESPALKCKCCGEELVRIARKKCYSYNKRGIRFYCNTKRCPVIFAVVPKRGEITWSLEARLNEE